MNDSQKQRLLQQIAAIPTMERGQLSSYSFKDRAGANGPYHKLQQWHQRKNHTATSLRKRCRTYKPPWQVISNTNS